MMKWPHPIEILAWVVLSPASFPGQKKARTSKVPNLGITRAGVVASSPSLGGVQTDCRPDCLEQDLCQSVLGRPEAGNGTCELAVFAQRLPLDSQQAVPGRRGGLSCVALACDARDAAQPGTGAPLPAKIF
jgi:hypothetical protein